MSYEKQMKSNYPEVMNTPYQDVKYLEQVGHWPDNTVPMWVSKAVAQSSVTQSITEYAYQEEIARLYNMIALICVPNDVKDLYERIQRIKLHMEELENKTHLLDDAIYEKDVHATITAYKSLCQEFGAKVLNIFQQLLKIKENL